MIKLTAVWQWVLMMVLVGFCAAIATTALAADETAQSSASSIVAAASKAPPGNVAANGDFEQIHDSWFTAWSRGQIPSLDQGTGRIEEAQEGDNHFMRMSLTGQGAVISSQRVALDRSWQYLDVSVRLRGQDIVRGQQHWQTARLEYTFENSQGRHIAGWPWLGLRDSGSTDGWLTLTNQRMRIPRDAAYLRLAVGLWDTTGTLDVDDVTVVPIEKAAIRAARIDPRQKTIIDGFTPIDTGTGLPARWQSSGDVDAIQMVSGETDQPVLRINRPTNGDSYISRRFVLHPWWAQMNLGMQVRTGEGFETGGAFRHGANLRYRFFDADDRQILEDHCGVQTNTPEWQEVTRQGVAVPPGAVEMELLIGLFDSRGIAEFRSPFVQPVVVEHKVGQIPVQLQQQWAATTAVRVGDHRATLSLDGPWLFQPAGQSATSAAQADAWGIINVPGSWPDAVVSVGSGEGWNEAELKETNRGWYQRTIKIPADWSDRSILLELDHLGTDVRAWVNGREAGVVGWPGGMLDITSHLKAGKDNELRLLVASSSGPLEADALLQGREVPAHPVGQGLISSPARGLTGSLQLVSRPRGGHISQVLVRPSTQQKKLAVDIELARVARFGQAQVQAQLLDEQGRVEKSFEQSVPVSVARQQTITVSWDWDNPRLFDVGQPNLYTLVLKISGPEFQDNFRQTFGFREFRIEGKQLLLNDKAIHLRPQLLWPGQSPRQLLQNGYNCALVVDPLSRWRGSSADIETVLNEAQQAGVLVIAQVMPAAPPGAWSTNAAHRPAPAGESDEVAQELLTQLKHDVHHWRNNPAIVMWLAGGQITLADRAAVGQGWQPPTAGAKPDAKSVADAGDTGISLSQQAAALVVDLDPTRPVFIWGGGGAVDSITLDTGLLPLRQLQQWPGGWEQQGQKPLLAAATSLPVLQEVASNQPEPMITEYVAAYLGPQAYQQETAEYRHALASMDSSADLSQQAIQLLQLSPAAGQLQELFNRGILRSWRVMGVNSSVINQYDGGHDEVAAATSANQSSLAWIAGSTAMPASDDATQPAVDGQPVSDFTDRTHCFWAGQEVSKQVVLLNDQRDAVAASYQWKVFVSDKQVADGQNPAPIMMQPAQSWFAPLQFTLPTDIAGKKVKGRIVLSATIGADTSEDTFEFEVFAPLALVSGSVVIFDPAGDTTAMIKSLGYEITPWNEGNAHGDLVIIGRGALGDESTLPGEIQTYLSNGGRVLLMAQDSSWISRVLGLRVTPQPVRRVFAVEARHPIVSGLDQQDLRNWGNGGIVADCAIIKPQHSGLRPILECSFDLAASPLLEMNYGRGRLIICSLNLEGHFADIPAANQLARRIVEYARTAALAPRAERVVYIGAAADAAVLDELGVKYQHADVLDRPADLLILGRGAVVEDSVIAALAGRGARVLVMYHDTPGGGPLGVKYAQANEFAGSRQVPPWPEAGGLSISDLRWRVAGSTFVLKEESEKMEYGADGMLGKLPIGQGVVIFAQVHPRAVNVNDQPYLRLTSWRQARALAQLLSNLGASFTSDDYLIQTIDQPDTAQAPATGKSLFYQSNLMKQTTDQHGLDQPGAEAPGRF